MGSINHQSLFLIIAQIAGLVLFMTFTLCLVGHKAQPANNPQGLDCQVQHYIIRKEMLLANQIPKSLRHCKTRRATNNDVGWANGRLQSKLAHKMPLALLNFTSVCKQNVEKAYLCCWITDMTFIFTCPCQRTRVISHFQRQLIKGKVLS